MAAQFAVAFAHNESVSVTNSCEILNSCINIRQTAQRPSPFAITLLTILLAHELGHFFASRHHHIRTSYPFFVPAPTPASELLAHSFRCAPRSAILARFFDVELPTFRGIFICRSGARLRGHERQNRSRPGRPSQFRHSVWRTFNPPNPCKIFHPNISVDFLLLHPVGRAAWSVSSRPR